MHTEEEAFLQRWALFLTFANHNNSFFSLLEENDDNFMKIHIGL